MKSLEIRDAYRIQEWSRLIQERQASGQRLKDYCAEKGITVRKYYYWLRKTRDQVAERMTGVMEIPKLVPLKIPVKNKESDRYILRYRSAEVEVPEGGSAETLSVILEALNRHAT